MEVLAMLGVYDYTVILTYISTLVSFVGISRVLQDDLRTALFCLMLSGLCDMFDGRIASTKKNRTVSQRRFGIQIDSLSDLICFGALPAVIIYHICGQTIPGLIIPALYLLCALIRLAWFNVDEEERQDKTEEHRAYYLGLPVTTGALLLPATVGLGSICHWPLGLICPALLLVIGVAFLTPFRLKKPTSLWSELVLVGFGFVALALLLTGVKR